MKNFLLFLQLLPHIAQVVKSFEYLLPDGGKGAAKLAALRQLIEIGGAAISSMWPAIETATGIMVDLMNMGGKSKEAEK
jgi:hypothetical protein